MKKGFTLIELSIVLVVVGLLIAGVLVGQSLINSAKVNRELSKLSQWSIAITQFKNKFKQYPGDSNLFQPTTTAPYRNNGQMNNSGTCPTSFVMESISAWSHLSQSKMLTGEQYAYNYANVCTERFKGITPQPAFKSYYAGDLYALISSERSGTNFGDKRYEYSIVNFYKAYDLWAIEKKLDDGLPSQSTGSISSGTHYGSYDCNESGITSEVVDLRNNETININPEDATCYTRFYFNQTAPIIPN